MRFFKKNIVRSLLPHRLLSLCGAVCLLLCCGSAGAQEATLRDVVVTNSTTDLLLYCSVENGFSPDMLESVRNGIPITFTFFVRLEQHRTLLPDREIASFSFDHTISYDNLKEEYQVSFSGAGVKSETTASLGDAERMMTQVNGFKVVSLGELEPDAQYGLKVKVSLARKTLPLNFHYIVPFWHLWDLETEWYTVRFRY